ncbi:unnamed protein product [Chondrus crispus]|uniref:Uncharacterized protein n=1 Tax=Chondrus crispus TaxID=2769 RepID=R7QT70_CHOCR|nr:unnamed protein product [Chondrus crispus]CDF40550.1 unnamed protein product [Chondrus crispus]|eukprot:XP_005710844.1 unnamed protein product [Chondrus crispus]
MIGNKLGTARWHVQSHKRVYYNNTTSDKAGSREKNLRSITQQEASSAHASFCHTIEAHASCKPLKKKN